AGVWTATCATDTCTLAEAEASAVEWYGAGSTPTGNSAQRAVLADTNSNADWGSATVTGTFGALNVGQE
ncbi:MAG: hypothetical protein M3Y59_19370, partial [Myxococcota bacterium]|nr:hypothetical protein [Myxococcota bacterium]